MKIILNEHAEYTSMRLVEWAEWFERGNNLGKGYPVASTFLAIQRGSVFEKKKHRSPKPLPDHEQAEEIEKIIQGLSKKYEEEAQALRRYYLDKQKSVSAKAQELGMSETIFRIKVDLAKMWISAHLNFKT